jgi:hypothetical protein
MLGDGTASPFCQTRENMIRLSTFRLDVFKLLAVVVLIVLAT